MHPGAYNVNKGFSHLLLGRVNKATPTVPRELPTLRFSCAETQVALLLQTPPDSSPSSIRVTGMLWEEHGDNANTDEN